MTKMTQEQMRADWIATKNIAEIQQQLDAEVDDGKSSILTQLLADEFAKLRTPQSGVSDSDRVTVDVGNPIMGFVYGLLLIAVTTAGFLLWEGHQAWADDPVAIVTAQNR